MATRPANFSQPDLTRALKAMTAAGFQVAHVAFPPTGGFEIFTATDSFQGVNTNANPCDRLLNRLH